ncbi:hypothetical protein Fmac_032147 [Flemingia macrophylla]|uniref:TIR domain-containing protein n=1 Tax=Flemingia macrophylla TaxID=520843 RepID=A0ABD1L451_9FABA
MTTSKGRSKYDVFINFRGKDARRKFVCHLYRALSTNAGVNTFLDEETLHRGAELGELMRVIEGSQIAVVVFSKAYTESSWCLLELEKIIECNKNKGLILLPVFYYIEPSHVRDQKGAFGKKLKATAQNTDSGALSRWSHALREATRFSGLHVRNYRNEAELVNIIVEEVLSKLEYDVLSTTTNFPVGLESRVQDVIRLIEKQSHRVCMLGIWGMGGVGKTTTAKFIYDRIHSGFRRKSFIGTIRNHRDHVPLLQEQLLWDILKIKVSLVDVGMGTTTIKNRLAKTKALIVLDDVDDCNQLQALCGNREWFGQGTVIIITTRNLRLLHQFEVDYPYELHKMDEKESLALFSWHAFGEVEPRIDFNELAKDAVAYCDGLPLALQCLGSDLRGRTETEWKSVLSKLKIIPIPEVQKNLKISYDDLDEPLQDIFLDICCVFIGEERDYVIEILNGCGLHADIGIPVLTERSLIKVENNSKLGMHPLVRDMGREIIRLKSKKHGKPSRLWFQGDVLNVLKNNTGTEFIEGLALKLDITNTVSVNADAFEEMKKLRLLRLHHVQPDGDYGCLSKQLRWIYWHGFPLENMPNNFCLEGVIAMDFKHSNLRLVWQEPKVYIRCHYFLFNFLL